MLNKIKACLGITDTQKDSLLTLLIDQAKDEAINYTHNENCIDEIKNTIIQMVIYNYNRIGSEGLDSEDYSGVIFNYSTDYPPSITRVLKSKRKMIVI